MGRPDKKPKYKLDPKKFEAIHEEKEKKDKDWEGGDIFNEIARMKSKYKH